MLCAQALAALARALTPLARGDAVDVRYNAEDVKRDLLIFAKDRGHDTRVIGPDVLRMTKG